MAKDNDYVVTAGYVTVETQVGAGRAWVDVPRGAPLPDDVAEETRARLLDAGHIARRGKEQDRPASEDGTVSDRFGEPVTRPVPGLVEPDEINPDIVPAGAAEDVLAWVGDDLARARVALHTEQAKGLNARHGLIGELEKVMADQEQDPPAVPESLVDDGTQAVPAPSGGITVPDVDETAAAAPAKAAPAKAAKATKATKATGGSSRS